MPGLTPAGLEIATLADVRAQISDAWRGAFGTSMDVSDRSPDGHLIGIVSEVFALFWELLEAITSSQDRDKATGALLRALCALTGTTPPPATFSTVMLTLTGTPTTPITAGSLVSTLSTGQQFTTRADATLEVVTAWTGSTAYLAGDRRTNAGNVYLCTAPGTSAASGGPTTTSNSIGDGTTGLVWRFLGQGTGARDVAARATIVGPVIAASGDLTSRDTPLGGWLGVINILDAVPGTPELTDAGLRVLAEIELAKPGTGPPDAVRAALLEVGKGTDNPVQSATIFNNTTDFVDESGVPPHSLEPLVHGGVDQDIWDALRINVPGGIRTHGTVVGTSIDSAGKPQTMKFSRTAEILIYVTVNLVKDPRSYPNDGDDQVRLAIVTGGNSQTDGTFVVSSAVLARVFAVPGVLEVALPLISAAPTTVPVATTTIAISLRQRGVFDTSRVTVISINRTT